MTDWVRLWHDMPTDPKWRTIARKSGQRVGDVMAVFNFLMVAASANADERGAISSFDAEDVATALDIDENDVQAILAAMQGKVLDGQRLTGWEKRQPKREDGTAAERKAAWKARKVAEKNSLERTGTHRNAPETDAETETDSSVSNDTDAEAVVVDPDKIMFDAGVALIAESGKSEAAARNWLGKARKNHGTEAVIAVIGRAKREGAVEPISFMEASLRSRARTEPVAGEIW
jgi:hypothetical protein